MQDDQKRVESVEVNIERVAPLHIEVSAGMFQQVLVGDNPEERPQRIFHRQKINDAFNLIMSCTDKSYDSMIKEMTYLLHKNMSS